MKTLTILRSDDSDSRSNDVKIFIADDDQMYLQALGYNLKKHTNYKIYCFKSGEECLKNMNLKPDLILLDYYLNEDKPDALNGIETLKKIKRISPNTIIIMLSGQKDLSVALNTLKAGAFTYIPKDREAFSAIQKTISYIQTNKQTASWKQNEK